MNTTTNYYCCESFRVCFEDKIIQHIDKEYVMPIKERAVDIAMHAEPHVVKSLIILHCPFCGVPLNEREEKNE